MTSRSGTLPERRAPAGNPLTGAINLLALVCAAYLTAVCVAFVAQTISGVIASLMTSADLRPALTFIFTAFGIIGLLVPMFGAEVAASQRRFCALSIAAVIAYATLHASGYAANVDYPVTAFENAVLPLLHTLTNK